MLRPVTADDILKIQAISDPQISPDSKRVLFTKAAVGEKNKTVPHLFTVEVETKRTRQWTQGEKGCGSGRWSPCGTKIAFVSGRSEPGSQIHLIATDGGEASAISRLPEGAVDDIAWSPDGAHIAFLFRPTAEDRTKKASKEREEKGLSTPAWVIDDLWYRLDGDGYFGAQRHAVYVLDVASGAHRLLYNQDKLGSYSMAWTPDSKALLVARSVAERPFQDPPDTQVFYCPLDGEARMVPGLPAGDKGALAVSPDGSHFAYLGDVDESDPHNVRNSRVWVVPVVGGEARCLTAQDDYCFAVASLTDHGGGGEPKLVWREDGRALRAMVGWHGESQLAEVDLMSGETSFLTSGRHLVGVGNLTQGRQALAVATTTRPNEVAVFQDGQLTVLTDFNAWLGDVDLGEPEEVSLTSPDGTPVQAWCLKPSGFDPAKRYPAVIEVHGGPHTQYSVGLFHEFQLLRAQGYVVVYSNPRGSKGYGEKFCNVIRDDWGNKDWMDVQTVSRWVSSQSYVDPAKKCLMGGSYGGFMANWAISHTQEFACAVSDRCVINWLSMSGNSDYPSWSEGYFRGKFWGALDDVAHLWQQSPMSHFKDVTTPTLVIHSEGDLRCNVEQGEQLFSLLKLLGVPTRFVRYPSDTSHGMSRNGPPDLRIHRLGQIVEWLGKYLAWP